MLEHVCCSGGGAGVPMIILGWHGTDRWSNNVRLPTAYNSAVVAVEVWW